MQQVIQYIRQSLHSLYPPSEIKALIGLLLEKKFGIRMLDVYMDKDIQFLPEQAKELEDILRRLRDNEPIQYILGEADFCGFSFRVNSHVLIPRPETAELVGWILDDLPDTSLRILDIGTGSGCIPIALSRRCPQAELLAWDISSEALEVARENNRLHGTSVRFERQDIFAPVKETEYFDVVVSNPPYITASEKKEMERNVLDWEPGLALFVPDEDPLVFYRRIAELGKTLLAPTGTLYLEINRTYGGQIRTMLEGLGYGLVELRKDLSGNDRMIKARL